jgi:hypothetical protein
LFRNRWVALWEENEGERREDKTVTEADAMRIVLYCPFSCESVENSVFENHLKKEISHTQVFDA